MSKTEFDEDYFELGMGNLEAMEDIINSEDEENVSEEDMIKAIDESLNSRSMEEKIEDIERLAREEDMRRNPLKYMLNSKGARDNNTEFGKNWDENPKVLKLEGNHCFMCLLDMHFWCNNLRNRRDYPEEILEYGEEIISILYRNKEINNVIIPGDLYHAGMKETDDQYPYNKWVIKVKDICESRGGYLLAVIGNHELTYSKNNLFWHQVANGLIKTPEDVYINGVHIVLDSYKHPKCCRDYREIVEGDICITHNEVVPPEVKDEVESDRHIKMFVSKSNQSFSRFKVKDLLVAHSHGIVGFYTVLRDDDTRMDVEYLGSAGRTNKLEVDDDFLIRYLPIFDFRNSDKDTSYEKRYEKLVLRSYEESLIKEQVILTEIREERQKKFREYKCRETTLDTINNIKDDFDNNKIVNTYIDSALNHEECEYYEKIMKSMNKLIYGGL